MGCAVAPGIRPRRVACSITAKTYSARAQRTLVLAVLSGALLGLLATGDGARTTAALHLQLDLLVRRRGGPRPVLAPGGRGEGMAVG